MKIKYTVLALFLASSIFVSQSLVFAQETSPSPSPSESPTTSPSPTPQTSPSPTPQSSPSPSPSPSPSASPATGGTTKSQVLGDTATLGSTSSQLEIAKWAIGAIIGFAVFLLVLKTARSAKE